MKGFERGFVLASVAAVGLAVARAYLLDIEDVDGVTQASATEKVVPPERPDRSAPACPSGTTLLGFDRVIETPDTTLDGLDDSDGWFVMNVGTSAEPLYQLGRVYPDGTIRLGMLVEDLTLLGPSSIPEVTKSDVFNPFDTKTLTSTPIPESEMSVWFTIPEVQVPLPDGYEHGLERRSHSFNVPLAVGSRSVTDGEVRSIKDIVFDSVDYNKEQPRVLDSDGEVCGKNVYANVIVESKQHGDALTVNEFPLMHDTDVETRSWVQAHELGHALDRVVDGEGHFNALSVEERKRILEELHALHDALKAAGKPYSLNTPREAIANVYAYLLKDPAFVKAHAPHAAQFFGGLVNDHQSLSRILSFK